MSDEEVWRHVDGYEGKYSVSNLGRMRNNITKAVMGCHITKQGYVTVKLRINDKAKRYFVHRLVGMAFIDNPNEYPCINHKDEVKTNNEVSNLEWCTYHYNCLYGTRIQRITELIDYSSVAEKNSKPIVQLTKDGQVVKQWPSITECFKTTGYDKSNITKCCRGKAKTAYGYKWEYKEIV